MLLRYVKVTLLLLLLICAVVVVASFGPQDDEIDGSILESFLISSTTTATSSTRTNITDKYQQYSGYLNATHPIYGCCGCAEAIGNSTFDRQNNNSNNNDVCQLHYWFIIEKAVSSTTRTENRSKPTLLWMNGGPGASSIIGLLQEMGPFLIEATTRNNTINNNNNNNTKLQQQQPKIIENPYRWTQFANLLVIENPVGVGYSYCSNTTIYVNNNINNKTQWNAPCYNTDNTTAIMTLHAIIDFYYNKFPELIKNELYIVGESYAGVYVPTVSYQILEYNKNLIHTYPVSYSKNLYTIPLVGIAVGDPCTDTVAQSKSMNPIWYSYQYGLLDDQIYAVLNNTKCHKYVQQRQQKELRDNDNDDFMYRGATVSWNDSSSTIDEECRMAYHKYSFSTSRGISAFKNWNPAYIDRYSLYGVITQDVTTATEAFMNHPLIRQALHIPEFLYQNDPTSYWKVHSTSSTMNYTKQYNACNHNADEPSNDSNSDKDDDNETWFLNVSITPVTSMIDIYRKILYQLPSGVMIYNGNTDPAISYEGTRLAVKRIGISEMDGGSYRPWFYHHANTSMEFIARKNILFGDTSLIGNHDMGIQLGGHVINYEHQLSFVTIHGSGHLVPQNRPQAAYHLISKFVLSSTTTGTHRQQQRQQAKLLSPLLPTNASLIAMNDTVAFMHVLSNWTELAKSELYTKLIIPPL